MIDRIVNFLTRRGKRLFIYTLFLAIIMVVCSRPPKIDGRLTGFNAIESEHFKQGKTIAEKFGSETVIQLLIEPELGNSSLVFLNTLKQLQTALKELSPTSKIRSLYQGKKLLNSSKSSAQNVGVLLRKASKIPGLNQLVGHDLRTCMLVLFVEEQDNFDLSGLDAILNKHFEGIKAFHVMSSFHVEKGIADALSKDLMLIPSIILLLFITIILLVYRSFRALLFCIILIILGLIPVFFLFTRLNVPINLVTVLVLPVVLILCVADAIHLLTGFWNTDRSVSTEKKITLTVKRYIIPSFMTSLTTAVAFFSFLLNDSSNIQEFGLITGCAVMLAFLFTYSTAPFLMRLLKARPNVEGFITKISIGLNRSKRFFSLILVVLFIYSAYLLPNLKFDTDFQIFFPKDSKILADHDKINGAFNSQLSIDVMLSTSTLKPDALQKIVFSLHEKLNTITDISTVNSYKDEIDFIDGFGIASQFIRLTMKNNSFKTADGRAQRLIVKLDNPDQLDAVVKDIKQITSNFEQDIKLTLFSRGLLFKEINEQVATSLLRSLLFSFIFIGLIMFAMTRSLRATFIGLFVNVIPLSFIALLIFSFNYKLNIVTALTAVVCMGIIVDDTIHILYRKLILKDDLSELRLGIITTSLVLFSGFSVLMLSRFVPSQTFGIICALIFIFTMITDLTLLPLLLSARYKKKKN
jgi:predicted RND superfamily exporter protein